MSLPTPIDFSDLEKVSLIGEGNSRTPVYKVIHRPTGKFYALKQLATSDSLSDNGHREIEILKDLNHPNIIKCYEVFEHEGDVLVLLEYMDCKSLDGTHITSELELAKLTGQVLFSLDYLHKRGLFHGNIRPSKIFMSSERKIKVAYMGEILSSYGSGSIIGYGYQSLECIGQVALDKKTMYKADIWSLGLSVLEFSLGFFPYGHALESSQKLFKIFNENPPEAPKTASPEFRNFISRCLQKDPTTRWSTEQLLFHPFLSVKQSQRFLKRRAAKNKLPEIRSSLVECPNTIVGGSRSAEDVKNYHKQLPLPGQGYLNRAALLAFHEPQKGQGYLNRATVPEFHEPQKANFGERLELGTRCKEQNILSVREILGRISHSSADYKLGNLKKKISNKLAPIANSEFENLPEYLKRCLIHCSLFPLSYEFEKATLVQLWIAEDLIDAKDKDQMEKEGSACFDSLAYNNYIDTSGFDNLYGQMKYRVNESKASSWYFQKGSYLRIEESK